jgi:hypothetical protein
MIRVYLMIFLFAFCVKPLFSQLSFELVSEQNAEADRLVVDDLGNIYLMNSTGIERRNAVGGGVFRTSEMQWGEFHDVDVTDPLRPFIHFSSSGKVVFFDNTLSVQGSPIDLFEHGYDNIDFMCGSRGDGYWLWDGRNSEIIRVDRNFNRILSTGNLSILLKSEILPQAMMERGSFLYVLNSDNTLHIFDMFGAWKKSLTIGALVNWEADSGGLFLFGVDKKMRMVDAKLWQVQELELPVSEGSFSFHSPYLYSLENGVLRMFKLVETTRN